MCNGSLAILETVFFMAWDRLPFNCCLKLFYKGIELRVAYLMSVVLNLRPSSWFFHFRVVDERYFLDLSYDFNYNVR